MTPEPRVNPLEAMTALVEGMDPLLSAVAGYKAKIVAVGFGEAIAEEMARDFHRLLLDVARKSQGIPAAPG